jgi:hypothetical protein
LRLDAPTEAAAGPSGPALWKAGISLGIVGSTYAAGWVFVSAAFWEHQHGAGFRFRDEGAFGLHTYAGGADKLGHLYANYLTTRLYADVLTWGGFSRTLSVLSSTLLTMSFFSAVEIKDGYTAKYGFSVGDMLANVAGEGAALALMLAPRLDDSFSLKLLYYPSRDFRHAVASDGAVNMPEDYSGQTYLLSFHLAALPPAKRGGFLEALRYLDLSLGYATRGYEPAPRVPEPLRQRLSLRFSLNLQTVFDDLLHAPAAARSTGSAVVHFVNEVYQPPYTSLPVFTYQREARPTPQE